jgi:hypothetical protein
MNRLLVEFLIQVINSLPEEDRAFLEEKLVENKHKREHFTSSEWQKIRSRILEKSKESSLRRGGKPLEPSPEETIRQLREERTEQLMQACFPDYNFNPK